MARRPKVPAGGSREEALLNALRNGNTRRAAAGHVGIHHATFYRMLENATFRDAVEKAEAEAEVKYLGGVAEAAANGAWQANAWWLERRRHEDYGRRDKVDIDLRSLAGRVAEESGLDAVAVMAEAERIVAGEG